MLCLIPARGGSKGIPNKNIVDLNGWPLIYYSISTAYAIKNVSRVVLATDSDEIALIAENSAAEVFRRPHSSDIELDLEVVEHAFKNLEGDYMVYLRPTTPLRRSSLVDEAIEHLKAHPEATCLRSAHENSESPYKMFGEEGDYFVGLYPDDTRPEYYNLPRQTFPKTYHPNGYVDIWKRETVEKGSLHGDKILKFITPRVIEVDTPEDLELLRKTL